MWSTNKLATIVAAVALSGQTTAFHMPHCWSSCFENSNVTSEASLCTDPIGSAVSACINSSCADASSAGTASAYSFWLSNYCHDASGSSTDTSNAISAPTGTCSTAITVSITTSTPKSSTSAVPNVAPAGSSVSVPYGNGTTLAYSQPAPTGTVSGSVAGSTSTAPEPYTGAAVSVAGAAGSMVVLLGGVIGLLV